MQGADFMFQRGERGPADKADGPTEVRHFGLESLSNWTTILRLKSHVLQQLVVGLYRFQPSMENFCTTTVISQSASGSVGS